MQENNFEEIITTWRRLSGEQKDSALVSMSGDSPDNQLHKKEEETNLLVPERPIPPVATVTNTGTVITATEIITDDTGASRPDEKQDFIKHDKENNKDTTGDINQEDKEDSDHLENNESVTSKSQEGKWEKEKLSDKVDSVYLRPPPPHKARSTASTAEEEDCGVKCLYYTLQCCDCVLM